MRLGAFAARALALQRLDAMEYVLAWLKAFALTVALELAVAMPLLAEQESSRGRRAGLILFAQIASHPAVWFIFPQLEWPWGRVVVAAEGWAVLSETAFYGLVFRGLGVRRAFGVAALANGVSYGVGLLVRAATGWV